MDATPISQAATDRRETARRKTGEFGTQDHAESGVIDIGQAPDAARQTFIDPVSAFHCSDVEDVYEWAKHAQVDMYQVDGIQLDVGYANVEIAMQTVAAAGEAANDTTRDADMDTRWAAADQHLARIVDEAQRRRSAQHELHTRRWARKNPASIKDVRAAVVQDLADHAELGLLPAGTSVDIQVSGSLKKPYIQIQLDGMPDDQVWVNHRRPGQEGSYDVLTAYGARIQELLHQSGIEAQTGSGASPSYPYVNIESAVSRSYRLAREAESAAQKNLNQVIAAGGDTLTAGAAFDKARLAVQNAERRR